MKILFYCFGLVLLLACSVNPLQAQISKEGLAPKVTEQKSVPNKTQPSAEQLAAAQKKAQNKVAAKLLPPKKVQLLYEVDLIEEEDFLENLDSPEALALAETQIDEQVHEVRVLLHLFSAANIKNIQVKVGTTLGATDFAAYSFPFDDKQQIPEPFSINISGKTVVLGMGQVKGTPQYQVQVILEGKDGQRSEPAYFTTQ